VTPEAICSAETSVTTYRLHGATTQRTVTFCSQRRDASETSQSEGKKYGQGKGEARWPTVCLSMYSITENIYCSQLSSVRYFCSLNLTVSHRIIQGKDWVLSPYVLSPCGLPLPPSCLLVTVNEARSYFAYTICT
jgi:hypothetical protein